MSEFNLEDIDVDGALRETAHEAVEGLDSGDTRLSFIRKAGLAGGAFAGSGAVLGALAPSAFARVSANHVHTSGRPPSNVFGKGDVGILNFALTLEYLEATFYNEATVNQARSSFLNAQEQVFLKAVTGDENQHVAALRHALGRKAIHKPSFNYGNATSNNAAFLKASFAFENTGVHAYSGQAFNIAEPAVLKAALSIVTVEARHASVVGLLSKNSDAGITPSGAFDTPFTATRVLAAVKGLNFITKLTPAPGAHR